MSLGFSQALLIFGRIALASLFVLGAVSKVLNYQDTLTRMDDAGIPFSILALPIVIGLEFIGGVVIALNLRWASITALVIAGYTLLVNAIFHRFWTMEEPLRSLELSLFFKNVSIAGALLMIASGAHAQHQYLRKVKK